jgi:uncharacterized protein (TIGR00251 family)
MRGSSPFTAASNGVRVRVRLTPRASASRLVGIAPAPDGRVALKVMVTSAAEDGKANAALIALLACAWRVAKSDISIVSGASDRRKMIHVAGTASQLLPVLEASLAGLAAP